MREYDTIFLFSTLWKQVLKLLSTTNSDDKGNVSHSFILAIIEQVAIDAVFHWKSRG